jgi:phosphate acetyltransferase
MNFIEKIQNNAKAKNTNKIVFPEGLEPRMIKAVRILKDRQLVVPILLGDKEKVESVASKEGVSLEDILIVDPAKSENIDAYAEEYFELRKHKGMTIEEASRVVKDPLFFAAFMVRKDEAKGAVAGSINTTGDVLRAAIQVVGLATGIKVVSSCFIMVLKDGSELTFGDCAVIPDPDKDQLASIAISSAETHKRLVGSEPKVAMLSFSTKGSAKHEDADKVVEATTLVKSLKPELKIDGELQFDAAYIDAIGAKKAPGSAVAGKANVYIFPDLNSGNIGYKIAQRLGEAEAIGPVGQGLAKPYNDLSRGCSVEDIVSVACISSLMA